ncbi:DUF2441 domain-containing protein [Limnobaculum parvum]|uniref:DUF2441 domain-containing protein n=1 Tax=Limnobaculum parvum TaxID=2172103 RepID=A0A2Y9TWH9_9GAMM|nr:DUF2441 domain-containing protein [Limnobaculum parvum]AWH87900.1 DUF2441 domain-containing protein [Limnobaculum parvum]
MEKYYTVDSSNGLVPFCKVLLGSYTPDQPEQAIFLNQIHPDGLSKHGYNYLYNPGLSMEESSGESSSLMISLIFELVRRSYFPEKPSRYQSLFACQQLSEVKQFRKLLADERNDDGIRSASIYEVITGETVHFGDMNLLNSECPILELYRRAHLYWSGIPLNDGEEPFWEVLIPLPVLIGQRIPE